jgi:RimJ/RimL family protein N-acetyltransferase
VSALVDSWLSGLKNAPHLYSQRLLIRPIHVSDVEMIQKSINDKRVCDNLSYTPHPYTVEMAESWVRNVNAGMAAGTCRYWTIVHRESKNFIGSIGLSIFKEQEGCEIHYWINADEWNRGYCSEATKRVIKYAFEDLNIHRLYVTHRENNAPSEKIIKKCGFIFEGKQRDGLKRFGKFENVMTYSMLRDEYLAMKRNGIY